jgi:hypothetical protein
MRGSFSGFRRRYFDVKSPLAPGIKGTTIKMYLLKKCDSVGFRSPVLIQSMTGVLDAPWRLRRELLKSLVRSLQSPCGTHFVKFYKL